MKAYLMSTCVVFGLIALAHIWRVVEEGSHLASEPFFVFVTVASAVLCIWAARLLRLSTRS